MKEMKKPGAKPMRVNFNDPAVPENARLLQPIVWQDETSYYVLLGADPQQGVFGCGDSVVTALKDWNQRLQEKLAAEKNSQAIAQFIRESMNAYMYASN
jgi:hypothetical protein